MDWLACVFPMPACLKLPSCSAPIAQVHLIPDLAGKIAFLANGYGGLHIIDVSDSANPVLLGVYSTWALDVVVSDKLAFVAAPNRGLEVVDISDVAKPVRARLKSPVSLGIRPDGGVEFVSSRYRPRLRR